MANRKISELTALTAPATGDLLPIVDISETAAADKNKKITYGTLLSSVPSGTAAAPSIAFLDDINTGLYSPGADQLAIATGGTGQVFVSASGNVGVGVAPSAWSGIRALQINSQGSLASIGNLIQVRSNAYFDGTIDRYITTGTASDCYQNAGAHTWRTAPSGTAGTAITFTQPMTLDASGRLLLGTSVPSGVNLLQVNSDALIYGITVGRGASAVITNTAIGASALSSNTSGNFNAANGYQALYSNTSGSSNTANGSTALAFNTTGNQNTANGYQALLFNTTGSNNTANGYYALRSNTTGAGNTANGYEALYSSTGSFNTAYGGRALRNNTSGSGNIGIGGLTSSGSNSPVYSVTTENDRIVMGSTTVTNAYIQVAWTVVSDIRDKINISSVPHGLSFVNALNPISYQFKYDRESSEAHGPVRYGFSAQDILELEGPNNVIIDADDPERLRYNGESLMPVLVNAIQELTAMVQDLQSELSIIKGNTQ